MRAKVIYIVFIVGLTVQLVHGQCQKQSNKDIHGGQALKSVTGKRESDCCQICRDTQNCKGYAWNSHDGGTCWLKSASGPVVDAPGVSIGIVQNGGTPGTGGGGQMGMCYSPFHHPNYGTAATIRSVLTEDLAKIKSLGFNSIRTYYAEYFGTSIADILNEQGGFTVALGIYMYPDHADWIEAQINTAVSAAKKYPGLIKAIYVGNENIPPVGSFSCDNLVGYINRIKQKLSQNGVSNVPVGSVQRYTEWVSGRDDVKRLSNACDVIGANLYPFFDPNANSQNPIPTLDAQLQNVKNKLPGKRIEITETGWSSGGSSCASSQPRNVDLIKNYFQKMRDWSKNHSEKVYFFQTFNKVTNPGNDCENYFGILDAYGNKKFDF